MTPHEQKILKQIFDSLPRSKENKNAIKLKLFTNACLKDPLFNTLAEVIAR